MEGCESKIQFASPRAVKSLMQQLKPDEEFNRIYYVRSHAGKEFPKLQCKPKGMNTRTWVTYFGEIDENFLKPISLCEDEKSEWNLRQIEFYKFSDNKKALFDIQEQLSKIANFITVANADAYQKSVSILEKTDGMKKREIESPDIYYPPNLINVLTDVEMPHKE